MIAGVGEALIGYRIDRDAGPLIMVAAGGVLTEIYRDRSLRLARLAEDERIAEAEINPLIVRPAGQGVVAVDALVRLAD